MLVGRLVPMILAGITVGGIGWELIRRSHAKCHKTWNALPHGRTDYVFCLWEADKPEDIETSLGEFLDYLTVDNVKVDEIDWAEYAKTL